MSEWLKDQLDQFVRDDVTISQALYYLGIRLLDSEIDEAQHDEFVAWIREHSAAVDDMVTAFHQIEPALEPMVPPSPKPELMKTEVGRFVDDYVGENVAFAANCNTDCWINEDGNLVFEDPDNESSCIVRMEELLERAKNRRQLYEDRLTEWETAQSVETVINKLNNEGDKDGFLHPCSHCAELIRWDDSTSLWKNTDNSNHTCQESTTLDD